MEKRLCHILFPTFPTLILKSLPRLYAYTARRSRTAEHSELVSEEAAYLRSYIFSLRACALSAPALCGLGVSCFCDLVVQASIHSASAT